MKKLFLFSSLLFVFSICRAEEQPPFEVKDPATTENFRQIYYQVDQLGISRDSNGNIILSTNAIISGDLTIQSINGTFISGFRNRIINGDMRLNQRYVGNSTTTIANANLYSLDRWVGYNRGGAGRISMQRLSASPPSGFTHYMQIAVATADASIGSGDDYNVAQRIEGNVVRDFSWGTADAKSAGLSFLVRSSTTGVLAGALQNGAGNRSYIFQYSINSANVWEKKNIIIPGDQTGTWATDATAGAILVYDMGTGTDFEGTANVWQAGEKFQVSGNRILISSANTTVDLTGVQLEVAVSSITSAFEYRSTSLELFLCQRYFEKTWNIETAVGTSETTINVAGAGNALGASQVEGSYQFFKVPKRVSPTVVFYTNAGVLGSWTWYTAAGVGTSRATTTELIGYNGFNPTQAVNNTEFWHQGHWTADSEL